MTRNTNRRHRRPYGEGRSRVLRFRATSGEHDLLMDAAKQAGFQGASGQPDFSAWARHVLLTSALTGDKGRSQGKSCRWG